MSAAEIQGQVNAGPADCRGQRLALRNSGSAVRVGVAGEFIHEQVRPRISEAVNTLLNIADTKIIIHAVLNAADRC